jgi:hypothetical protein
MEGLMDNLDEDAKRVRRALFREGIRQWASLLGEGDPGELTDDEIDAWFSDVPRQPTSPEEELRRQLSEVWFFIDNNASPLDNVEGN